MQIHFKFRCRFTIRCNIIIRNYMRMTTIILNYIHGHQCQGMRRSLRVATGPDPTRQQPRRGREIRRKVLLAIKHRTANRAAAVRASGADGATDGHADAAA